MDRSQISSIFVLISSIESQLQAVKSLIANTQVTSFSQGGRSMKMPQEQDDRFTTQAEDDEIGKALELDKRDEMLQAIFQQAGNGIDGP